jgi:ABC-type transport system substrate-binding protein
MRRFVLAIIAATLLIGLAGGVARAATSASPSPGGDKVVLRIGMLQPVDNLNPFAGVSVSAYEVYHLNYDLLVGYAPTGDVTTACCGLSRSTPASHGRTASR